MPAVASMSSDLVPPQGPFVTALSRAGCVILGKTVTTEFAMGGINLTHRLPWNPCDPEIARMTGGSSHGSAVAMAAGMAAITFGSDTGGSVRWPAALCGVVGYKATSDHWPVEGVFPLSKNMDSLGVFTSSAADAAFVEAAMRGQASTSPRPIDRLVLGVPTEHYFDNVDQRCTSVFRRGIGALAFAAARTSCRSKSRRRANPMHCSRAWCLPSGLRFLAASASLPTRKTWIPWCRRGQVWPGRQRGRVSAQ